MPASGDLIDFDVIEGHKENIQALPGGRSARKLAALYSPSPLDKLATPRPSDTKNVNDFIRAEYEAEVQNISESDDPLDVFDRYVRWTLDAYPTAQATPQSQLHTLLERATRAFITSAQYKNDPRYLKLWMHYVHLFADAPRETYMFLSRHGIGDGLALFYEEYAAWLEAAGKWAQAEEVYKAGIEREARPVQRLLRKFKEFEERLAQQPAAAAAAPSSPALPTVRPALAAKTDPFGSSSRPADPQAQRQASGISGATSRPAKPKLAVFSDAGAEQHSALSSRGEGSRGWDTIGSLSDGKKENVMEPKPWVGETLKAGGKKAAAAPKLAVFRDASLSQINNVVVVPSKNQVTVHPQTGKKERIFVDLAQVYPVPEKPGTERSFEEIMAANRGWLDHVWDDGVAPKPDHRCLQEGEHMCAAAVNDVVVPQDGVLYDENGAVREPHREARAGKKKVTEVNETQISEYLSPKHRRSRGILVANTQTVKAKLDSPSGPKLRKKNASEPTMTLHTRAATDDIYEIFNAPLNPKAQDEAESADEDDYETDGDYTTDAESTGTTRHVEASEQGDEEMTSDVKSLSEWSDFSTGRHVPSIRKHEAEGNEDEDEEAEEAEEEEGKDPDEMQTSGHYEATAAEQQEPEPEQRSSEVCTGDSVPEEDMAEVEEDELMERPAASPLGGRTIFIPLPPEDYDAPTRPYRDPAETANNRLPFMTPITERTECSLDVEAEREGHFKTPCKRDDASPGVPESLDMAPLSSPLRHIADDEPAVPRVPASLAHNKAKTLPPRGPLMAERQCNPVDEAVRQDILSKMHPPLTAYAGFYDHRGEKYEGGGEMRRFAKGLGRASKGAAADKTAPVPDGVAVHFPDTGAVYRLKRELGAGAFAPVYLVEKAQETGDGGTLEALKMESPPTAWEFHMMRVAHARLGPLHRATASLSQAREMHLYRDEAFLLLPYHAHGTLLDVVNLFRGEPSGVMDELLAMFFAVELLRTVEALHSKGVLHGDVKADNCLLRLDALPPEQALATQWRADGSGGWWARGLVLIDFGRSIDMKAFVPDVEFIADWKTCAQDCAEMREGRPWTWQIDYYGLAGTMHCLLFGKYMETARCDEGGGLGRAGRRYRIRESLKRYWQTELWGDCFEVLLNPGSFLDAEAGGSMPVLRSMRSVRERMEAWLEANCERGVGLRSLVGKLGGGAQAKSRR